LCGAGKGNEEAKGCCRLREEHNCKYLESWYYISKSMAKWELTLGWARKELL
jgi:hypothetical protein